MRNVSLRLFWVFFLCCAALAGCRHSSGIASCLRPADPTSIPAGTSKILLLPGDIPMEMVWIPAGDFLMGARPEELDAYTNESPQHRVIFSRGFWLGKYEVTQAQWQAVMETAPWAGQARILNDPKAPAVYISWLDTQAFINSLNRITAQHFRLPSEAEWEYACRAGKETRFYWGEDPQFTAINDQAWWRGTALNTAEPHAYPVGRKSANPWGLHDMSGNVFEWCQDWYAPYNNPAAFDPIGPEAGERRINRGGSWITIGGACRAARRGYDPPTAAFDDLGFRLALTDSLPAENPGAPQFTDVFVGGKEGIDTYRIPSMLVAADGALLAFCEARKVSIADASPTDMVLRRSLDGGSTWQPMQVLVRGKAEEALMNPCPIIDRSTGTILLFCLYANAGGENHNRHILLTSKDNGATWSAPVDAAPLIEGYDDTFVSGPGIGIQLKSGRLVVPGYAGLFDNDTKSGMRSRVIYSDDGGAHWTMGAPVPVFSDESQAVELCDGTVMLNMRADMGTGCRGVALSRDGGASWADFYWDYPLNECPCQASILRYGRAEQDGKNRLLFSNPDNRGESFGYLERTRMTVRLSEDEGKTWPVKKLLHAGPSSYSCLVRLPDGDIGILFEGGEKHRREWIRFGRFSLDWLTGDKKGDRPQTK